MIFYVCKGNVVSYLWIHSCYEALLSTQRIKVLALGANIQQLLTRSNEDNAHLNVSCVPPKLKQTSVLCTTKY